MPKTFVISDTHFGHANIIKYCGRPFSSVEEMDETMIENWNKVVGVIDLVWHLGDIYFPSGRPDPTPILKRLNGRKRWVLGNHDRANNPTLQAFFGEPHFWQKMGPAILTHAPLNSICLSFGKDTGFKVNIHGHIHEKFVVDEHQFRKQGNYYPDNRYVNVSVEQTGYKPVDLDEIVDKYR